MNQLYFARLINKETHQTKDNIVFLFTRPLREIPETDEAMHAEIEAREEKALSMVSEHCRHQYVVDSVEPVCVTADTVDHFEPV